MSKNPKKEISRRTIMKGAVGALAAAGIPLSFKLKSSLEEDIVTRRPSSDALNVIFMTADDIGWRDLSCYGNTNVETPNLDALCASGMKFNNAFGVSSSCSSSRASFITGQYISTHGVDGLVHRHLGRQLSPSYKTMANYFKNAGYHTAIEGKWHIALFYPTSSYGYLKNLSSPLIWKRHIKDSKKIEKYLSRAADNKRPFYLELNFTDTHRKPNGSFPVDERFKVDPDSIEVPEWMGMPNWKEIRKDLALYYGMLKRTDYLVGQTMKSLKENDLDHNTIIIFVSDNGAPFPGNKMSLLDRGIATPLVVSLPGKIAAGQSDALVSTIDIMPTVLDICGLSDNRRLDGRSFKNLLLENQNLEHREFILAEMNYHVDRVPMRAYRDKKYKAILNLTSEPLGLDDLEDEEWAIKLCEQEDQPWLRPRVPFELYDLELDPNEKTNLAKDNRYSDLANDLKIKLSKDWNITKKA